MQDSNTQDSSKKESKRSRKKSVYDKFKEHLNSVVSKINGMVKKDADKLPK